MLPIIDFFYPPFKRLMNLQTFRYLASGGGNTVLGLMVYYISYKFIFFEKEFDFSFYAFKGHIAALIASFSILRLGTKNNLGGASTYPEPGDPSVSVRGLVPVTGATRHYQVWYRNAASFCTASTFNLTNAMSVIWTQ